MDRIHKFRWAVVAVWVVAALALTAIAPAPDHSVGETSDLLPADTPVHLALDKLAQHFGDKSGLSAIVVVFERRASALSAQDLAEIERIAALISQPQPGESIGPELQSVSIRSPATLALAGRANPLISADGRAALIWASLPFNYITKPAGRLVKHTQEIVAKYPLPPGMSAAVSGSAGYGYDYAIATERSHRKTMVVTLISVILILLLVYRSPIAALIPLLSISLAAAVAFQLIASLARFGFHNGMAEQIFTFVLLYGAGVDYSLLVMSRYREFLQRQCAPALSLGAALKGSFPAIVLSAVMTMSGVAMLCFARFSVFHNAGPSMVLGVFVAASAAVTLTPALLAITGPRAFWSIRNAFKTAQAGSEVLLSADLHPQPNPSLRRSKFDVGRSTFALKRTSNAPRLSSPKSELRTSNVEVKVQPSTSDPACEVLNPRSSSGVGPDWTAPRQRIWPAIARIVVRRPGWIMLITLAALVPPAVRGVHIPWSYDALFSLKSTYPARQGTEMVERHWPTGEIAPINVLVVAAQPYSVDAWTAAASAMTTEIGAIADVADIRAVQQPLGLHVSTAENAALLLLNGGRTRAEYLSPDRKAMRLSVVLRVPPLSLAAMDDAGRIRQAAVHAAAASHLDADVDLAGATAETIDIRTTTQQDFLRVAGLALAAVLLVVTVVLRDLLISVFILAATVLSYLTAVGLAYWFFHTLGAGGLEWKVQMLLFIVLVAVGQDYSIFFAVRLAQEGRHWPPRQATERALVFTGPVISSCGLIMAATLGSVMAGDVQTLVQLGFAFVLGMLIDTFLVRPLLLPAFVVLTGRTLRGALVGLHAPSAAEVNEVAAKG